MRRLPCRSRNSLIHVDKIVEASEAHNHRNHSCLKSSSLEDNWTSLQVSNSSLAGRLNYSVQLHEDPSGRGVHVYLTVGPHGFGDSSLVDPAIFFPMEHRQSLSTYPRTRWPGYLPSLRRGEVGEEGEN